MPLVRPRVRVEHNHAPVAVAIRYEDFIRLRIHHDPRRPVEGFRIVASAGLSVMADLKQVLSILRELQNVRIVHAIAADPDVVFVIDEHPMQVVRPFVTLPGSTPALNQIAGHIEFQYRRRG